MSDKDDLFIVALQDIKTDIRGLNGKFDEMNGILVKNTVVLEQHESRSTASELRITSLEDQWVKIKGFFLYTGLILTTVATLGGIFNYIILPFLRK